MSLHRAQRQCPRSRAQGVGLVTAIFLLVILSALGVAMVSVMTSQHASMAMDVAGAQAYQAARAGVEWGLYNQLQLDACAGTTTLPAASAPTLSRFTITVRCTSVSTPRIGSGTVGTTVSGVATKLDKDLTAATVAQASILVVGMRVAGAGIAPGTRIANINGTAVTLSMPATLSNASASLNYISTLDRWRITSSACTEPGTDGNCPNAAPASADYAARQVQVDF
jgi:MSHA biogenesis protein MshP